MGEILKIFKNKKNNQLFVPIPRKKFDLKGRDPVSVEIDKDIHVGGLSHECTN